MTEGLDCSLARSTEEREREGWDKKESSNASGYQPYSNNKGRTPCKFWQAEGKCKKGNGCHFWHGSDKGKDNSKQPSYRNSPGRTPAQPPARSFSQSTTIRPTPPVTAGNIHPLPRAAPNREQINFLRNITHPLLGTNRSQGEPGSVVAVTNIPIWMDEVGVLFLFAPYGAINSCELDGPGSVRIHYAHARAAVCHTTTCICLLLYNNNKKNKKTKKQSNAVLQLNSFRFGAESIGVVVVS